MTRESIASTAARGAWISASAPTVVGEPGQEQKRAWPPPAEDDFWYGDHSSGGPTLAGPYVTPESAMRTLAVNACVRVLAETAAQTPLIMYRRVTKDGREGKERATGHPLYDLLRKQSNRRNTAYEFKENLMVHLAMRGNGYARILEGPRGFADQLEPLHSARVKPELLASGAMSWLWWDDRGREHRLMEGEVFHVRGLGSDGVSGWSPITMARQAIGLTAAAEGHGARLFSQGAAVPGVLETPETLSDAAYERLKRDWQRMFAGAQNAWKIAILERGMKYNQVGLTSEDAQFLETRKFQVQDIARLYRVPLHMIGDLDKATFSNIEHQSIEFIVHTMGPWFTRIEEAISRDLIIDTDQYFAEFFRPALLKGDTKSRYDAYAIGRNNGWLSVNEIRSAENMNPIEGGDEYLTPLNMKPAGEKSEQIQDKPQQQPGRRRGGQGRPQE